MASDVNIDLFLTDHGESGLICNGSLGDKPSGIILDAETNQLTLEFGESGETLHLNIPVDTQHIEKLLFSPRMQIGTLNDGMISDFVEVSFLYLNDPYGSCFGHIPRMGRPRALLVRFEQFMKRCTFAQAVHRADIGDEGSVGSVLKGVNPRALEFAPQLLRAQSLQAGPQVAQDLDLSYSPRRIVKRRPPSDDDSQQ